MRGFWKRIGAVLCALALCAPSAAALAEFSPRWEKLESGDVTLELGGSLENWSKVSKQSLETVNEWLSGLKLILSTGKSLRAEAVMNGESLFSASVSRGDGYTLTTFAPSGNAYLTSPEGQDALALLTGRDQPVPDVTRLPALYAAAAPGLYAALADHAAPKTVKEPTSIKNASASASYVNYVFRDGKLNEAWEDVLNAVLPALKQALADNLSLYAAMEETLSSLVFSGECRFKRFLDKEGGDMGMQFTGQAARGKDKRKVTLFGGYTKDKGGYVSMTLAGVGSKDSLKGSLGFKLTSKNGLNTLETDGSYTKTKDKATVAYTVKGTLKNTVKEENEHWTGKMTLTATENKVKTTWVLSPDLTFDSNGLEGDIQVQQKTGSKVTMKGGVHAALTALKASAAPAAQSAKDLRPLSSAQARAAVAAELAPLAGAVARLASSLPEEERTLLLHELRTDEWMNGPAVPAQNEAYGQEPNTPAIPEDGNWTVEEDEQ